MEDSGFHKTSMHGRFQNKENSVEFLVIRGNFCVPWWSTEKNTPGRGSFLYSPRMITQLWREKKNVSTNNPPPIKCKNQHKPPYSRGRALIKYQY